MKTFVGKFLVRKSTMTSGVPALVICGVAIPQNFDIASVADNDEVWQVEMMVTGGKEFVHKNSGSTGFRGGPEDFISLMPKLGGEFSEWQEKKPQ